MDTESLQGIHVVHLFCCRHLWRQNVRKRGRCTSRWESMQSKFRIVRGTFGIGAAMPAIILFLHLFLDHFICVFISKFRISWFWLPSLWISYSYSILLLPSSLIELIIIEFHIDSPTILLLYWSCSLKSAKVWLFFRDNCQWLCYANLEVASSPCELLSRKGGDTDTNSAEDLKARLSLSLA
jgi:hypothetical protein